MKYIVCLLFLSTFLGIYASQDSHLSGLSTLNENRAVSSCWFKNKSMAYPFENIDMQNFFGEFNFKQDFTFLDILFVSGIYFLTIELLFFNPFYSPLSPFIISDMLNSTLHTIYICNIFENITKSLTHDVYHLQNEEEIKNYLMQIKNMDSSICECTHQIDQIKALTTREHVSTIHIATVPRFEAVIPSINVEATLISYKITLPTHVKESLEKKIAFKKRFYFYSACMPILLTWFISVAFDKPVSIGAISRMLFAMLYNFLILYSRRSDYVDMLRENIFEYYEHFVKNVHNTQLSAVHEKRK
ncbi:MAG TPA: hypothetical protein VL201_01495 [Patescibacteria group bacterium]|jgi:hypothetical protein|nr:hypothetical protein [Patescibacteria group bacterium]